MSIATGHRYGIDARGENYTRFAIPEDLSLPIQAKQPIRNIDSTLKNRAALEVRIILKRRVQMRINIEALSKTRGRTSYVRLKERCVTLSVGSVAEAERAIDAVLAFAMSLDGKHLVSEQDTDKQVNSSESASDS